MADFLWPQGYLELALCLARQYLGLAFCFTQVFMARSEFNLDAEVIVIGDFKALDYFGVDEDLPEV